MEAAEGDNFDDAFSDDTSPAVGRSHADTHSPDMEIWYLIRKRLISSIH